MKSFKTIFIIFFSILLFIGCCDCFDEEQFINISIKTKNNIGLNTDTSGMFKLDEIDSCYLIKTEKNNLNKHIDTNFLSQVYPTILAESEANFDYIIKNDKPPFEHFITDISSSFELSGKRCNCRENEKTDFKFDGVQKHIEDLPIVIKKE